MSAPSSIEHVIGFPRLKGVTEQPDTARRFTCFYISATRYAVNMSTPDTEFAAEANHAYRLAEGANHSLPNHVLTSIIESIEISAPSVERTDNDFIRDIWLTTSVLRRRGEGPTLVLVPLTEVGRLISELRAPLDRLGLRFGIDIIIYGVLETETVHRRLTDDDISQIVDNVDRYTTPAVVPVPADHHFDAWDDVHRVEPGLVVLIGQTDTGDRGVFAMKIESWLNNLPQSTPVLRYWEKKRNVTPDVDQIASERQPGQIITPTKTFLRPAESAEIAAQLLRPSPPIVSITGKPGIGRTSLLAEVAGQLEKAGQPMVLRMLEGSDDGKADGFTSTLDHLASNEARVPEVIVLDDFDRLARLGWGQPHTDFINTLSSMAELGFFRFLLVLKESRLSVLEKVDSDLAESIEHIRLNQLPNESLRSVIKEQTQVSATAAGLTLTDDLVDAALSPAHETDMLGHPGLGIARIESAIARARQRRSRTLKTADLELSTTAASSPVGTDLKTSLGHRIRGQEDAVRTIVERLTPSLRGLKLSTERPHGVFLLAGPSGSGKTEMAKQLAQVIYGTHEALVRLDMSEFADEKDARMKLIGASRIWQDSTTDGLLTTKIRQMPRSVVLLDEFEKAAPAIWNLFLQVFDEGRLTDGWGHVADFSETIIVLTSNLGVKEGSARSAGFGTVTGFDLVKQDVAIVDALPPELLNRITSVVRLNALSTETIREIARLELDQAFDRFSQNGWHIEFDEEIVIWIADSGYDPRYGARHLQRNIERQVLPLLTAAQSKQVRLEVRNQAISATEFS